LETKRRFLFSSLIFFLYTCKSLQGFGSGVWGKGGGGTLLLENHAHVANEKLYVVKGP
jgi:hypothetical protein